MIIAAAITDDAGRNTLPVAELELCLRRTAQGDPEAFGRLYELAGAAVYSYALSLLRSREEAEDVLQDTFLRIRGAAHLYAARGTPMAWIMTIARNLCMQQLRGRRTDLLRPDDPEGPAPSLVAAGDRFADAEDRMVLETAFSVLDEQTCSIILLHAVSGLKHREIAQMLQMPLPTVLSRYHRGIGKLRRELEDRR